MVGLEAFNLDFIKIGANLIKGKKLETDLIFCSCNWPHGDPVKDSLAEKLERA